MNNNYSVTTKLSPVNYNTGKIQGFFNWQGNPGVTFEQSHFLVYIIYAFVLVSALLIFIFKNSLYASYNNNKKRFLGFYSRKKLNMTIGIIGLSFFLMRIIVLGVGGYPNAWELVPLQFCRLFILIILLLFLFNKIQFIKYIGFFSIGGAIIGLTIPDLGNSSFWHRFGGMDVGYNSYVFWDFFFAHSFAFLCPMFLLTFTSPIISKREVLYTTNTLMIFTLVIFFIDLFTWKYGSIHWAANYFYMGHSSQITVFGVGSEWPLSFIVYTVLGYLFYTIFFFIWIFLSKNQIYWVKKNKMYKPVYSWIKSEKTANFKNQTFFRPDNKFIKWILRKK